MKHFDTKYFFKKNLQILVLVIFIFLNVLTAFSKSSENIKAEASYKKAKSEYYRLLKLSKSEIKREKWIQTARKFNGIWLSFPATIFGYKALFTSAKLYKKSFARYGNLEDFKKALIAFQKVASINQADYLGDDALFHAGELLFGQNDLEAASISFKTIISSFPKGDMVKRARNRLAFINRKKTSSLSTKALKPKDLLTTTTIREVNFKEEYSREWLIIKTDRAISFTDGWLSSTSKFAINLPQSKASDALLKNIKINGNYLKRISLTPIEDYGNRITLEFKPTKNLSVHTFQKKNLIKILIQPKLKNKKSVIKPRFLEAKISKSLQLESIERVDRNNSNARKRNWKIPYIVIDPGHGGKDNGAIGRSGLFEKNLNLKISKYLRLVLKRKYSYKVSMTREDDRFIALDERGKFANEKNADLFVSIHVNAAKRKGAYGIETYYLGRGSSNRARDTAKRENGELVYKVPDDDVQKILTDMITNRKINDSSILARWIQDKLFLKMSKMYSRIKNLGVKEGPFFVLHSTKMPSVLVEVGFITNPKEELRLSKSQYLKRLAESIAYGISFYIKDKKPTI